MITFKKLWADSEVFVDADQVILIEAVVMEDRRGSRLHLTSGRDVEVQGDPTSAYMKIEEAYRIF